MKSTSLSLLLLLPLLFTVHATSSPTTDDSYSTYIVHVDPSSRPKHLTTHQQWHTSIISSVKSSTRRGHHFSSLENSFLYSYQNALHGFSAVLSQPELQTLRTLPGFLSAYKDKLVTMDTTYTPQFMSLNPSTGLWPASNYGEDVIIGVIDTGIYPESPSFSDHGMKSSTKLTSKWKGICQQGQEFNSSLCNSKLIGARYFNKGVKAANPTVVLSMNSARDTQGHGTHTSSTAAGNYVEGASFFGYAPGVARGMAPRARVAIYKVLWDEGRYASDVLAGMDQAVADGVDIISISMGFDGVPLYEDPVAIASFGAMAKGILVSSSAGNTGTRAPMHNGIPWVLTVAAGNFDRFFAASLTVGNKTEKARRQSFIGRSTFPLDAWIVDQTLIYNKTISKCDSLELLSEVPRGIVVCDDTGFLDDQMDAIASMTNLAGAIFVAKDPSHVDFESMSCPGVLISATDLAAVLSYIKSTNEPVATIKFQQTVTGEEVAPTVAEYTSRGPSPNCPAVLKPDVLAPGSLVLASWIPDDYTAIVGTNILLTSQGFNVISGTSMACPHASGVAALLKGAHPEWSHAAIRSAMMTTATELDNTKMPIKDGGRNWTAASPLAMGAGHIVPNKAVDPGLVYDATPQDYVSLLCSMNYTKSQIMTITRSNGGYDCANASLDLNYPSFVAFYDKNGTGMVTRRFRRVVTNVVGGGGGGGATTYKVKVEAPMGAKVMVWPESLVFGKMYDRRDYYVEVTYSSYRDGLVSYGSIVWVEESGKHVVRSPIVLAPASGGK